MDSRNPLKGLLKGPRHKSGPFSTSPELVLLVEEQMLEQDL